jgi:hypothetical protein
MTDFVRTKDALSNWSHTGYVRFELTETSYRWLRTKRGIVKCCVLRSFSSGGFLQDSVLEGTAFDDECDLFVAA